MSRMAASALPNPGTAYGPCTNEGCGHRDCDSTRELAAQPCKLCGGPIGYDRPFYQDGTWTELTHQLCSLTHKERTMTEDRCPTCGSTDPAIVNPVRGCAPHGADPWHYGKDDR